MFEQYHNQLMSQSIILYCGSITSQPDTIMTERKIDTQPSVWHTLESIKQALIRRLLRDCRSRCIVSNAPFRMRLEDLRILMK